jgi:excisionase family DNA binding protein
MSERPPTTERLLTTEEVADYFRTVPATVRYWRHVGKGPRSFKVGRRVLYRESDVQAWQAKALGASAA